MCDRHCRAEQQRRSESVPGDMAVEPDDVPRLLTAENSTLAAQRLEERGDDVGRQPRLKMMTRLGVSARMPAVAPICCPAPQ
mgnify:CR=1 FL=1